MKKKALIAAVVAATAMSATTAFAATNPFKDVPADHWSYDALNMLAEDGVIEGYGDGTFQGDKLMNRYEMAEIVAKAAEKYGTADLKDKGAIKKLTREYAAELKDMDARLTAVEGDVQELKKNQSSFKWYGDARVRYFKNKNMANVKNASNNYNTRDKFELRTRLSLYGEPAKNVSVTGQLKVDNDNIARHDTNNGTWNHATSNLTTDKYFGNNNSNNVRLNRMEINWNAKNGFTLTGGRTWLSLGQGLIYWENPMDGVFVRKDFGKDNKGSLLLGAGDASVSTWADHTEFAQVADLSYKVSPAVKLTATFFNSNSDSTNSYTLRSHETRWGTGDWWSKSDSSTINRDFRQFAYGINAQLAPRWNLIAEGIHNSADVHELYNNSGDGAYSNVGDETRNESSTDRNRNRNGFWTRLTYGNQDWSKANTFNIYGEYFALGGLAIDSTGWSHRLNIAGGNGYGGAGARGFGFGASYMLAANTNLELTWYKLKPYDKNSAGFKDYKDVMYAALSYSF